MSKGLQVLKFLSNVKMDRALMIAHAYMTSAVASKGGVEAVRKDMAEAYGSKLSNQEIIHAMTCGAAIMLTVIGGGIEKALGSAANDDAGTVGNAKDEIEAEREAANVLERIRKLH